MGVGVLDVNSAEAVPGTIHLEHFHDGSEIDKTLSTLKHAHGKNNEKIILAPQPLDDPNDPLNWPFRKKALIAMTVYMGTIVRAATTAQLLTAGNVQISHELNVPVSKMVQLSVGYYILPAGAACPFVGALALKYGKRPVYVVSSTVTIIGCVVGATASGYNSLLTARVLQGIGQVAYETLVFNTIADLLFVHERGPPVALGVFFLNATANVVGIISGSITTRLGWRYCFWILLPFGLVQTILTILFVAETSFRRKGIDEPDAILQRVDNESTEGDIGRTDHRTRVKEGVTMLEDVLPAAPYEEPHTRHSWLRELRLYNGTFVDEPFWSILLSYAVVMLNLGVTFAVICCGLSLTWFAATLTVSSVLYASAPYNFTTIQVGYTSAAPTIGAILGGVFMGLTSDRLIRRLTHRNRGIYEPEFQLPLSFAGGVCIIAGMVSLGYNFQQGNSFYVVCVCSGIAAFGFTCCNATYVNYALSSFRDYSNQIIVMSTLFRNFLGYGMSIFIVPWLERDGPLVLFGALSATIAGTLLLVAVFYVLGKKYRFLWHRHNVLKSWHLEGTKVDERG